MQVILVNSLNRTIISTKNPLESFDIPYLPFHLAFEILYTSRVATPQFKQDTIIHPIACSLCVASNYHSKARYMGSSAAGQHIAICNYSLKMYKT